VQGLSLEELTPDGTCLMGIAYWESEERKLEMTWKLILVFEAKLD
jgi:hypothetical protein